MIGEGAVFFPFYFPHFIFESFSFCHFISCHFVLFFFSDSNKPFNVCSFEKILQLVLMCFGVQVQGTPWPLHISVLHPMVLYFLPHWRQCVI
jgi:hypothetical protein